MGLRVGALATLTEIAENKPVLEPIRCWRRRRHRRGESRSSATRARSAATFCQRPRCWYFRGDLQLLPQGRRELFALKGENEFHAIFGGDPCYIVHPSDTAPALVALDAKVTVAGPAGRRTIPLSPFFVLPKDDFSKENILEPAKW